MAPSATDKVYANGTEVQDAEKGNVNISTKGSNEDLQGGERPLQRQCVFVRPRDAGSAPNRRTELNSYSKLLHRVSSGSSPATVRPFCPSHRLTPDRRRPTRIHCGADESVAYCAPFNQQSR